MDECKYIQFVYQYDHVDKSHHYGIYHQLELLTKNGETSLTEACYHGKLESVTVLLRAGAKTDIQDKVCIHNINLAVIMTVYHSCQLVWWIWTHMGLLQGICRHCQTSTGGQS